MSAIALVVDRSGGRIDVGRLERLIADMAWRGPDQQGTWYDGSVGLGASQLWTTPEDVDSSQPAVDPSGRYAIVLDGRVDNRPELCDVLGIPSAEAKRMSDALMVLAAYRRWGRDAPGRIAGAYTGAVWDASNRELVVFRDALGHRPFFYRVVGDTVYAASSLVALRTTPTPTSELDEDYLWDFVCSNAEVGSFDIEATPFRQIRRLPAGHSLTISAGGLRVDRWWKPWTLGPLDGTGDDELVERFRTTFIDVVRAQLRAVGTVGATLSGGLDSSSIVCTARHLERAASNPVPPVHAISTTWAAPDNSRSGYDERHYVEAVNRRCPGPYTELSGDSFTDVSYFGSDRLERGEPYLQFGTWWSAMSTVTAEIGGRVLLTGHGGDAVLTGNGYYLADLLRVGRLGALGRALRGHARRGSTPYPLMVGCYAVAPFLARHRGDALVRLLTKQGDRTNMDTRYPWPVPSWVREPEAQRRRGRERVRRLGPRRFGSIATQHDYEAIVAGSSDHTRAGFDDVALRAGVELREPFHDVRLVELALQLPASLKFDDGVTKVVLRRALADMLPPEIRNRRDKSVYDFALLGELAPYGDRLEARLADSAAARHGFIERGAALELLARTRQGGGGDTASVDLFTLLSLEDWLQALEADDRRGAAPASSDTGMDAPRADTERTGNVA